MFSNVQSPSAVYPSRKPRTVALTRNPVLSVACAISCNNVSLLPLFVMYVCDLCHMSVRPVTAQNFGTRQQHYKDSTANGSHSPSMQLGPEVTGKLGWALVLVEMVYHGTHIFRKWNRNQIQCELFSANTYSCVRIPFPRHPTWFSDGMTIACTLVHINTSFFRTMYLKEWLIRVLSLFVYNLLAKTGLCV